MLREAGAIVAVADREVSGIEAEAHQAERHRCQGAETSRRLRQKSGLRRSRGLAEREIHPQVEESCVS